LTLRGFDVIDEAKFNALPDDIFLDWRRRGWLHLAYCHFMSMANWGGLVDRHAKRLPAAPA
jgi:SapC